MVFALQKWILLYFFSFYLEKNRWIAVSTSCVNRGIVCIVYLFTNFHNNFLHGVSKCSVSDIAFFLNPPLSLFFSGRRKKALKIRTRARFKKKRKRRWCVHCMVCLPVGRLVGANYKRLLLLLPQQAALVLNSSISSLFFMVHSLSIFVEFPPPFTAF